MKGRLISSPSSSSSSSTCIVTSASRQHPPIQSQDGTTLFYTQKMEEFQSILKTSPSNQQQYPSSVTSSTPWKKHLHNGWLSPRMRQLLIFTARTAANGPYDDDEHVKLYILPLLPKRLQHYIHSPDDYENTATNNHVITSDSFIRYMSDAFLIIATVMEDTNSNIQMEMKSHFHQQESFHLSQQQHQFHSQTVQNRTLLPQQEEQQNHATCTKSNKETKNIHEIVRMEDMIDILLRIAQNEEDVFDEVAIEQGWVFPITPFDHDFDLVRVMLLDSTCF